MTRTLLSEFDLDNPLYANAVVTAYGVTVGGAKDTDVFVNLYSDEIGGTALQNPQKLTSRGRWRQPVYTDEATILEIVGPHVASHDTGIVRPSQGSSVALGGGAAPTLGTIGGSGPATAAQDSWVEINIAGTLYYVPAWV